MRVSAIIVPIGAAAVIAALVFPWLKAPMIVALCYGLAALGVAVLLRAGQLSFGHGMFALIGGYATAFLGHAYAHLDALVLIVAGAVCSAVAAMLVGILVVRYRGIFFAMLNLAISMVLYTLVSKLYHVTGGSDGMRVSRPTLAGFNLERADFESALLGLMIVAAVGAGWLVQRYFQSSAGQALAAIKTNETRLEYLGISVRRVLWNGYLISAALAGMAGAVMALLQGLITPEIGYWMVSGEFVFIAVLGGAGHALGAFLGAIVYEGSKLIGGIFLTDGWHMLLGAILIVVIFAAPTGISGLMRLRAHSES